MADTFLKTYANQVKNNLDFLPTWPLTYDVKLGDVGVLDSNGVFKLTDTLENLGIESPGVRQGQGTESLEFTSRNGVEVVMDADGEAAVHGVGAKVEIRFSREGAVFLRIGDHLLKQFEGIDQLGNKIIELYKSGNWQKTRVVVTQVVTAPTVTVLVSGSSGATASFKLDASLPARAALCNGKFSQLLGFTGSFTTKIIGENVSPLFRTCGLRRKWFSKVFDYRSEKDLAAGSEPGDLVFDRVDSPDELQ